MFVELFHIALWINFQTSFLICVLISLKCIALMHLQDLKILYLETILLDRYKDGRCVLDSVNTSTLFSKYGTISFFIIPFKICFCEMNFPDSTRSTSDFALIFSTWILYETFFLCIYLKFYFQQLLLLQIFQSFQTWSFVQLPLVEEILQDLVFFSMSHSNDDVFEPTMIISGSNFSCSFRIVDFIILSSWDTVLVLYG